VAKRLLWLACLLSLSRFSHAQECVIPREDLKKVKAPIRHVVFTNDADLSSDKKLEIVQRLRAYEIVPKELASEMSSIAEETDERVRAAFQDEGYFKAQVTSKAVRVVTDNQEYDIVIPIRAVGRQYRLGDLNIVGAMAFSEVQLRDLFLIQRGEIFSRKKIAEGLDALRRLYGSQGYINFVPVPKTEFDDASGTADLEVSVDEGKQFRLRSVEVLSTDSETKARVLDDLAMKPGDIFSSEVWERTFTKFRDLAQNPDPNAVNKRLDEQNGLVDMVLDFRKPHTCPIDLATESAIPVR
jgi:outer membrane protein assembly factor BamA